MLYFRLVEFSLRLLQTAMNLSQLCALYARYIVETFNFDELCLFGGVIVIMCTCVSRMEHSGDVHCGI